MKKLMDIKSDFLELSMPMALIVVKLSDKLEILFANEIFVKLLGCETFDELRDFYHDSAWNFVSKEDFESLHEKIKLRKGKTDPFEVSYRAVKKDGNLIWVFQNSRHTYDEDGEEIVVAYYKDITSQKLMEQQILAGANKYETLINSIPGGVGMYRCNDKFTPIFMSERTYELCSMTHEEYEQETKNSTLDVFHPDDRQGLLDAVRLATTQRKKFEYTHRVKQKDGTYRWMRVAGQVIDSPEGEPILYTVFTDLHEQIKAEQALRESEFRYAAAVKASNINIWEYFYATDTMTIFSTSPKVNPKNLIINNYLNSVIEEQHITGDSAAALFEMIKKLKDGEAEVTADLWIRDRPEDDFWCERVVYTNIYDESGKPYKAYCVGHDVTKEKEAEKRYLDELSYREAMQKATVASINVNLTCNTILDYKSNFDEITDNMRKSTTVQDYFLTVYAELTNKEMRDKCAALFNRTSLMQRFADGETTVSMELARRIEGRRYWTVLTAHMMKKRETNEIVAFLYSTNVTNERTMQNVMNAIVKTDYDFLVVVDAQRNSAVRYSEKNLGNTYAYESENFEEETREYVRKYLFEEDRERVISEVTTKNILEKLDKDTTYSIFYKTLGKEGQTLHKQLRFSYINKELKSFLMTRVDITAAVQEQEKKNQELVAAVEMAQQANEAKSEFLSRISHEIRTPMNAIMGMNQLALQHMVDPVFVEDCIKKSQYSSQYLMLLINDILDMSKIESGNVVIESKVIDGKLVMEAINTIIGMQAKTKGVEYSVTDFTSDSDYLGDSVRLQQILINILSNAVKFTPAGGKVDLKITHATISENIEKVLFTISDTGIGISPGFLPNIFKPFTQEHSSATTGFGGSGLGLAISKNIAVLMGGDITVESELGKGTTFYVTIPFLIHDSKNDEVQEGQDEEHIDTFDFAGKKILLVEDHDLNIMVAKKLLEFTNIEVDVAVNGKIALDILSQGNEKKYDAILMDIRMPIMDGLEAAQRIRSLDNAWAKTIPIIAMSANAFDEDRQKSKAAGMNAHLAKPIDSQLLYRTLSSLMSQKGDK